jgi:chorismate mutase
LLATSLPTDRASLAAAVGVRDVLGQQARRKTGNRTDREREAAVVERSCSHQVSDLYVQACLRGVLQLYRQIGKPE